MTDSKKITVEQMLARAYAIEREAQSRYADLADQMLVHNNQELAALFGKLAEIEGKHATKIRQRAAGAELPYISPLAYRWPGTEAPENVDISVAHYLMTPHHALKMALAGEQRAVDYFEDLTKIAADSDAKALAEEFVEEEREHVELVKAWLERYPEPPPGWDEDHDPPMIQE
jgi:rubrerythrin